MSILPLMIFFITAVVSIITIFASIRRFGPAFRQARQELRDGRAQTRYRYSVINLGMVQPRLLYANRKPAVRNLRSFPNRHQRKHAAKLAKAA